MDGRCPADFLIIVLGEPGHSFVASAEINKLPSSQHAESSSKTALQTSHTDEPSWQLASTATRPAAALAAGATADCWLAATGAPAELLRATVRRYTRCSWAKLAPLALLEA